MFVQAAIQMADVDLNVRMCLVKSFDTFRSSDNTHEFDVSAAMFLDHGDGINSRTACCQHWVADNDGTFFDRARQFAVVFMRLEGFFVTVETDMADFCRWNESKDTFNHTETCAQNRNDSQLTACDHWCLAFFNRCFDFNFFQRQVIEGFKTFQHSNLFYQMTKFVCSGFFFSEDRNFVLDQWMVKISNVFKFFHNALL